MNDHEVTVDAVAEQLDTTHDEAAAIVARISASSPTTATRTLREIDRFWLNGTGVAHTRLPCAVDYIIPASAAEPTLAYDHTHSQWYLGPMKEFACVSPRH